MKAQAAIEYLSVFGMALILSAPFIVRAQGSIIDLRRDAGTVGLHNSLDNLETSVKTVDAAGAPSRRTFEFESTSSVEGAYILNNDSVVYNISASQGYSQLLRTFETNLTGELPTAPGTQRVSVQANSSGVVAIEVLS